jgi:Glycosyl hydrolases family 35
MQYNVISGEEQIPLLRPHLFSSEDQRNIKRLPSLRRSAYFMLVPALMLLFFASLGRMWMEYIVGSVALFMAPPPLPNTIAEVDDTDCLFRASAIQVPRNQPGVPSFWNYHTTEHDASNDECVRQLQPIRVSYDERAIRLNDERVLLLGGSLHPARLTQQMWQAALDEAVQQGLNLITMYVIWSEHQPFSDEPLDFTLQWNYTNVDGVTTATAAWDLQQAIREVANHGLFVHIRVGPYVCAEYNYGGIPEWLPLVSEQMSMRRPNAAWMMHMEDYVTRVLAYLQQYKLFAFQGGPIILAQIENEIGSDMEDIAEDLLLLVDAAGQFVAPSSSTSTTSGREETPLRNATMQDYADWCGAMAQKLAPEVVWTMCSGLSANNTISTYNGFFENRNDIAWMESYGDTRHIQIDQPALWTEHEGTL